MSCLSRHRYALAAAICGVLAWSPSYAVPAPALDLFSGSGTWNATAPSSLESAPDATWSFSFDLPQNYGANPTTSTTNFQYFLNGSQVKLGLASVQFYSAADQGGLDLNLKNGDVVNLYGQDFGSGGSPFPGTYATAIDSNSSNFPTGTGSGSLSITPVVASVPEPGVGAVLATSLLGLGWMRRRRIER